MPVRKTRAVRHQFFLRVPPSRVFRALTDPTWIVRWLADRAEFDPRRNGNYLLAWNDGPEHTGTIVEFHRGKRVTLAWRWPDLELDRTRLKLSVRPRKGGTLLEVEHTGFPRGERWVDLYGGTEWGWTYFFLNLKSVLENGKDLRSPLDG